MKKLLGIVLSAAMLLSMAACGSTAASSAASSAAADSTADAATATDAAWHERQPDRLEVQGSRRC